ncbi:Non-specific lipid-transfer protein-like protein [Thalictrum thalictroides]|uniref:Non-specific lipid-transfer protein-like protein n=1 Tax=Thalictrum thalictroides TaxID=46969 RepID=A0A7J6UX80_THATH|nr:Non-specific lipid-transfer protein-like protein [Thalictrum thalictroides]
MACEMMKISLIAILVTMLYTGAAAQSSCTNVIISMSPCLNYITGNSSTPSSSCCSQLSSVVRSQPQCLCQVLNGGASSLGLNINQTQALQLPNICNVQTPPLSRCNAAAPSADAPSGASDSPPTSVPGSGSKTVPATDVDSSNGSSTKFSSTILFSVLFIASYVSATGSF